MACFSNNKQREDKSKPERRHIVLIFKDFPEPYKIQLLDAKQRAYIMAKPSLSYFNDKLLQETITPRYLSTDTLVIPCDRNQMEFRHSVNAVDHFDFIFEKGDTVLFSYQNNIPNAAVLNRKASDFEINYDKLLRSNLCKDSFPALIKIVHPFMFIRYNVVYVGKEEHASGLAGQISKVISEARLDSKTEIEKEKHWIDSLYQVKLLSQQKYNWLLANLDWKRWQEKIFLNEVNKVDALNYLSGNNDSLLQYHAYRQLITFTQSSFYERKVKRILTSNSNLPNYNHVYDSILRSPLFSKKSKELLLVETTELIVRNSYATEINVHLDKFRNDLQDTSLVSYVIQKYQLKDQLTNDLELENIKGEKTTLFSILKKNKGKVVYIDFWASWCAPCIREFPSSKSLYSKLKKDEVQFIYLSIDDETDLWKKAHVKHQLDNSNSFIVRNRNNSVLLENIKLTTIPRYLLVNKVGEIVMSDAPRPGDKQTFNLLKTWSKHND